MESLKILINIDFILSKKAAGVSKFLEDEEIQTYAGSVLVQLPQLRGNCRLLKKVTLLVRVLKDSNRYVKLTQCEIGPHPKFFRIVL